MTIFIIFFATGIICGLILCFLSDRLKLGQIKKQAQWIVDEAQFNSKEELETLEKEAQQQAQETLEAFENDRQKWQSKNQQLLSKNAEREKEIQRTVQSKTDQWKNKKQKVDQRQNLVDIEMTKLQKIKNDFHKSKDQWIESLLKVGQVSREEIINDLTKKVERDTISKMNKWAQYHESEVQEQVERLAKKHILIALNRFKRPYCPERSLGYLVFQNEKQKNKIMGNDNQWMALIEKTCGVDLIYNEKAQSLSVSGFDPVRREWARFTLEKLSKEHHPLNEKRVLDVLANCKKDLFRKIRKDGDKVASELGLNQLQSEIKNTLGSLRYRYSFTQNQYFHCAEVGYLCGLLATELGIDLKVARRSGLLHDIGKAMDHSIDGGHAVIGADYVEKHGESEEVVHAIRAHHFDETPETDLAFLVIGADAISGARPGARRSTTTSYMQKMDQLQVIGNSFDGVIDTFILNAGREVRVKVDSHLINDQQALDLSQKVAKKIEEECSYPGVIRVTVVRETQSVKIAK